MWIRRVGKEGPGRRFLLIIGVLVSLAFFARPAGAGTITVAWDRMWDPTVTGYRVFVGTTPGNPTLTFDVPADSYFFIFRSAFMGVRYYFSVAAEFNNATIGARSYEVTAVGTRTVTGELPDGARVGDAPAVSECAEDCFVVTELARGLGEITSLAVSNDGAVLAVEGGRRVMLLQQGVAVPVFVAEPGTTLREIALDPRFDATGHVFLSVLRPRQRGDADVEILRLRHLAGTLAEPSAFATGVAAPLDVAVPFTTGADGLLYLAAPQAAGGVYAASVLAFEQDGRIPAGQRVTSPVVGRGLDYPADMAWDDQSGGVWLVGRNEGAESQMLAVSRAGLAAPGAPAVVGSGETATAVAAGRGTWRAIVGAGVDLIETIPGTADTQRISLDQYGAVVAVAAMPTGERVVAARRDDPAGASFVVLKVADGTARTQTPARRAGN